MKPVMALITMGAASCLLWSAPALGLSPSLDITQYGHTAWTSRDAVSLGVTFAMAQTHDGYLWLGSASGLFRFDGVHLTKWQPPVGQQLPANPYSLLVTRDGTLWIGTFAGLASWNGTTLTQYPELSAQFLTVLFEDRDGIAWVGTSGGANRTPTGRLCAIRGGQPQCYSNDGAFGTFVWSLSEDRSGTLWVGAESGLWRWKPGPPTRFALPRMRVGDLSRADDGRLLIGIDHAGLKQFAENKLEAYPIHGAVNPNVSMADPDVDSNKLLRDRDGGLWIGSHERGLIHIHQGRTDTFTQADGLSGNVICSLFEDREGNIWVGTTRGLDRFRELPVTTISEKQGLPSTAVNSVLAGTDESVWIASHDGLFKWMNGRFTVFRKSNGLPSDIVLSLYQDYRGRIWAFTARGLAYLANGRFVAVDGVLSNEVYSITGDQDDNLWLSGNKGLSHLRGGRLVEHLPWSTMGRSQQAKVVVADRGGIWLAFWEDGGVLYFKDGQVRASYTGANGLPKGHVSGLRLDKDGAVWAATQGGGLSRIKDSRIATLTTKNGLPCDTMHWSIEDDDRSVWLFAACGLVRISRTELQAWIADPNRRIETTIWDAADGITVGGGYFGPPVAKSTDGKIWFETAEGDLSFVDPTHLATNYLAPPVNVEKIEADRKTYWQNLYGEAPARIALPALTRDLRIDFTALTYVAPEKVHFKYRLEGQDSDWREVVNEREVQYSNLPPRTYRFRVIASNNSGIWNEQGDALEFSVAPAYYQTNWFRALGAAAFLLLVWAIYRLRVRRLRHEFALTLDARVGERTSIARELHDTLLQSFQGLMLRFQIAVELLPERPMEARQQLEKTMDRAANAIAEGRDAVQGLRASVVQTNDLARAINTLGEELATDPRNQGSPAFSVTVEGESRELHPILRDEIYRIAAEALRNAFHHANARQIEVEIRYDDRQFRLHVRDNGKGIDQAILSDHGREGHYGLPGIRERAELIGGKLEIWSEVGAGTELELRVAAASAYSRPRKRSWLNFAGKA